MKWYDDAFDGYRCSLCIGNFKPEKDRSETINFSRIADLKRSQGRNALERVSNPSRFSSVFPDAENPPNLYHPNTVRMFKDRDCDFIYLLWKPGDERPDKPAVLDPYKNDYHEELPDPIEILICPGCRSESDLRFRMAEGIPFVGKTTRQFLLVYQTSGEAMDAIICNRSDFEFINGFIRLQSKIDNPRMTVLSVATCTINSLDIIDLPADEIGAHRMVYERLGLPSENKRIPIRPLEYYAGDFVKWLIDENALDISKAQRKKFGASVQNSLTKPEIFSEYLKASLSSEEETRIKEAIKSSVEFGEDKTTRLVRTILEEDETFSEKCQEHLLANLSGELAEKNQELVSLQKSIKRQRSIVDSLIRETETANQGLSDVKAKADAARKSLAEIESQRESVLREIEENIALRLGLHTVVASDKEKDGASFSMNLKACPCLDGRQINVKNDDISFEEAIRANLAAAGLLGIESTEKSTLRLASNLASASTATGFIAISQNIAEICAHALSLTQTGTLASRIVVPTNCSNADALAKAIEVAEGGAVIVENVLDAVNESILFPLSRLSLSKLVVFPIGAYSNLRLLAPEVWGNIAIIFDESCFCMTPSWKGAVQSEQKKRPKLSREDLRDEVRDLVGHLGATSPPIDLLRLPAIAFCLADAFVEGSDQWAITQLAFIGYRLGREDCSEKIEKELGDAAQIENFEARVREYV